MKRIYVVIGELEDTNEIDTFDAAYPTMEQADNRCYQLEKENTEHIWYWREVILMEEED